MIPWLLLDKIVLPHGGGELRLMKRGSEFSIMLGQNELMNSRRYGSEEALATIVCERLKSLAQPRILIGGLGMGFTLRAALAALGTDARIVVAELLPSVIAWAKGPMANLFGDSLTEQRVNILEQDVRLSILAARSAFDAILLDVDNGPNGLTQNANDALYSMDGLNRARTALRSGGLLAVWSSASDAHFTDRLRKSSFDVEEMKVRSGRAQRGARHTIWIATRNR
jgi:spermidine synthase